MRTLTWRLLLLVVAAFSAIVLSGCGGGSDSHDVPTEYAGNIYGVQSTPSDGSIDVSTDSDVIISWPYTDYPPPSTFNFKMEEENSYGSWTGVTTELIDNSTTSGVRSWRFAPVYYLSSGTWFKVTVSDDYGHKEVIMFRTTGSRSISSSSKTPATGSKSSGSVEHRIQVK